MNENDLRDCFAMFIVNGLLSAAISYDAEEVWQMADEMLKARKWKEDEQESGIAAFKPKRVTTKKVPNAK
jgi:hypothetical protein